MQSEKQPVNKSCRLNQSDDFKRVFQKGRRFRGFYFTVHVQTSGRAHARLGIIISKKAVSAATRRNRLRRIIRESFRLKLDLLSGLDVITVVSGHSRYDESVLWQELNKQWSKLNTQRNKY